MNQKKKQKEEHGKTKNQTGKPRSECENKPIRQKKKE